MANYIMVNVCTYVHMYCTHVCIHNIRTYIHTTRFYCTITPSQICKIHAFLYTLYVRTYTPDCFGEQRLLFFNANIRVVESLDKIARMLGNWPNGLRSPLVEHAGCGSFVRQHKGLVHSVPCYLNGHLQVAEKTKMSENIEHKKLTKIF